MIRRGKHIIRPGMRKCKGKVSKPMFVRMLYKSCNACDMFTCRLLPVIRLSTVSIQRPTPPNAQPSAAPLAGVVSSTGFGTSGPPANCVEPTNEDTRNLMLPQNQMACVHIGMTQGRSSLSGNSGSG